MTRAPLFASCALLALSCATGSYRSGGTTAGAVARDVPASDRECDPATNGALIGVAVGGSPVLLALLRGGGERNIPYFFAGFVGAIAGFWIGIGVDEAHCETDPE